MLPSFRSGDLLKVNHLFLNAQFLNINLHTPLELPTIVRKCMTILCCLLIVGVFL